MKIAQVTLQDFRSFGRDPEVPRCGDAASTSAQYMMRRLNQPAPLVTIPRVGTLRGHR
jgi:hypothetical protein